jgi:hypothetical protein
MRPGVADCPQWTRFRGSRPQQRRPGRTWYGRPRQTSFHVDVPSTGTFSAATGSNRKTNFHSWPQLGEVVPAGTGSTMALWLMDVAQPGQALIARPGIGDHCGALGQMGRGVSGPVDPSGGERRRRHASPPPRSARHPWRDHPARRARTRQWRAHAGATPPSWQSKRGVRGRRDVRRVAERAGVGHRPLGEQRGQIHPAQVLRHAPRHDARLDQRRPGLLVAAIHFASAVSASATN